MISKEQREALHAALDALADMAGKEDAICVAGKVARGGWGYAYIGSLLQLHTLGLKLSRVKRMKAVELEVKPDGEEEDDD